ncbi:MAG: hypothetical protein AUJ57_09330 [Zetaproteobacteria bacterium CG1_02_53_45]|nr:MAG: hypothetical protein AUJ57_09330 [Zetaproteobacteria bacterium CG1_02_53_45]
MSKDTIIFKPVFTLNEAAAFLGKGPQTLRNWRCEKRLPCPVGYSEQGSDRVMFLGVSLLRYLSEVGCEPSVPINYNTTVLKAIFTLKEAAAFLGRTDRCLRDRRRDGLPCPESYTEKGSDRIYITGTSLLHYLSQVSGEPIDNIIVELPNNQQKSLRKKKTKADGIRERQEGLKNFSMGMKTSTEEGG